MSDAFTIDGKGCDTFATASYLIRCYSASRDGLKHLGILRTDRNLQGDYAEWLVARHLKIRLVSNTVEKGIDAFDGDGKSYQIKSRIVKDVNQPTSFNINNIHHKFDYLVAVFFDHSLNVLGILRVSYASVMNHGKQTASSFRFRWGKGMSSIKVNEIEHLFWPSDVCSDTNKNSPESAGSC
jgi:hypothetical protein